MRDDVFLGFDPRKEQTASFYDAYIASFLPKKKVKKSFLFCKRTGDILLSFLFLSLLLPLFVIIPILIKLDSRGSVFFVQKRVGKDGKLFSCYKFRTMYKNAPRNKAKEDFADSRLYITRVGRFLRRTSLDEIPQFFCCLIGTMSLIGPRPVVPGW